MHYAFLGIVKVSIVWVKCAMVVEQVSAAACTCGIGCGVSLSGISLCQCGPVAVRLKMGAISRGWSEHLLSLSGN